MKQLLKSKASIFLIIFTIAIFGNGCEETDSDVIDDLLNEGLGWFGMTGDNAENLNAIEDDIYLGGSGDLPTSVDLSSKFPPVNNQGSYGTCVAWSVGYNLRTFLHKKQNPSADITSTSNQFSPKDLFWAIPDDYKGPDCAGTNFEYALDVMVSRGIATLSSVPYTSLGSCSYNPISGTDASDHKILNYRQVAVDINTIKSYLAQGRAVSFGARLGDNFMNWNSTGVLSSDTYDYSGMHAYHAMVLTGYDDNQGANGAFRVLNSWGSGWGDQGYIWVDYDFFVGNTGEFCFCAFVAATETEDPNSNSTDGIDLVAWELADFDNPNQTDQTYRYINYDVFNIGDQTIAASERWNILYLAYDAYDANNYQILIYDYYTDEYGSYGEDGNLADQTGAYMPGYSGNWWNYVDVPANVSVADALWGMDYFTFYYQVPPTLTGDYYFVLLADGFDVLAEDDEDNNYFFFAQENGDPINVINGVMQNAPISKALPATSEKPEHNAKSPGLEFVTKQNINTYSPSELGRLIKYQIESGEMQKKVAQYIHTKNNNTGKVK